MPPAAESEDASLLQRRARRRLVGAIALVVFVVIVFPLVLDKEPKPAVQDLVIQIPNQDAARYKTPLAAPVAPAPTTPVASTPAMPPAKAPAQSAAPETQAQPARPADSGAAAKPPAAESGTQAAKSPPESAREAALAQAALDGKEAWIVRLGAFSDPKNVRQLQSRLNAAGLKSYTEMVKGPRGEQTRVRVGPFESKAEAERAGEKLKSMGIAASPASMR